MGQTIKGLLFDKDGTLFDFNATWGSWAAHFFKSLFTDGQKAHEAAASVGFNLSTQEFDPKSVVIAGTPDAIADAISKETPHLTRAQLLEIMNETAASAPQAEVVPLLAYLQNLRNQGYRLGVATNDAEAPARAHLKSANIEHAFDFIAGYDSGYGAKPEPGMQLGFCKALSISPSQVAMIGDSTHDLLAGKIAGMKTVAVLTGLALRGDLEPHADVVLDSIAELPEWLDHYNAQTT